MRSINHQIFKTEVIVLNNSKNILVFILCMVLVGLAYFNYAQSEKITLLNDEILILADKRKEVVLDRYLLSKEQLNLNQKLVSLELELEKCVAE